MREFILKVKPEPKPKPKHRKYSLGQQVKANEKAPGDYRGREGIITDIHLGGRTTQYGVRFSSESGNANDGYLDSWMLDPIIGLPSI